MRERQLHRLTQLLTNRLPSDTEPYAVALRAAELAEARAALRELPAQERAALVPLAAAFKRRAEVRRALGVSERGLRKRVERGNRRLRDREGARVHAAGLLGTWSTPARVQTRTSSASARVTSPRWRRPALVRQPAGRVAACSCPSPAVALSRTDDRAEPGSHRVGDRPGHPGGTRPRPSRTGAPRGRSRSREWRAPAPATALRITPGEPWPAAPTRAALRADRRPLAPGRGDGAGEAQA